MKTKTYQVYSFSELSETAKKRAIEDHRQFLSARFDSEHVIEDAKNCLAFAGFDISKIYYSGFSCQGDGACFEGSWDASKVNVKGMKEHASLDVELHRIAEAMEKIAKEYPEASFSVKHSGHYYHCYCTVFEFQLPEPTNEEFAKNLEQTEKDLTKNARDAMQWIYRQLEKEYEYQTSEEHVIDFLEMNEYEFDENGKID